MAARTLISKLPFNRSAAPLLRLRPLISAIPSFHVARTSLAADPTCYFSTRAATSSLNDRSPNWSNRPPKETILLDGCDFEHWLVVVDEPEPEKTRDEIIDSYIKTLAKILGSEDEARKSIYSVSTKHYFAFGCKVSEELSYKIKELPKIRWVLPDSYLDVKNKDYGGEPFIDGQAVPYDPKYHEEWCRNNARAMERNRRPNDSGRSRRWQRQTPMQNQGFQSRDSQGGMPAQGPPVQHGNQNAPHNMNSRPSGVVPNYQNQMLNAQTQVAANAGLAHQGNAQAYVNQTSPHNVNSGPSDGVPNYQNQMPKAQPGFTPNAGPSHQGNAQAYQGGGAPGIAAPSGASYQGSNQQYQGGNHSYQGSGPAYPGGNQGYQGGHAGYNQQGGHSGYQGNPANSNQHGGQPRHHGAPANSNQYGGQSAYQGAPANSNQHGSQSEYQGGAPYYQGQSSGYQGGGYQPSGYPGVGSSYQQVSPPAQGRDIPGRDQ